MIFVFARICFHGQTNVRKSGRSSDIVNNCTSTGESLEGGCIGNINKLNIINNEAKLMIIYSKK